MNFRALAIGSVSLAVGSILVARPAKLVGAGTCKAVLSFPLLSYTGGSGSSDEWTFKLKNTGSVTFDVVSVSGIATNATINFIGGPNPSTNTLAPGDSVFYQVNFTLGSPGSGSVGMSADTDVCNDPQRVVPVTIT